MGPDAGPLVAILNRRERHHSWARRQFARIEPPAITCEAAISETCFLLRGIDHGVDALMKLLHRGAIATRFSLADELPSVAKLLKRYASVPMSLADACLVRMSEQFANSTVLTLDSDFRIFRKSGRTVIPTLMP